MKKKKKKTWLLYSNKGINLNINFVEGLNLIYIYIYIYKWAILPYTLKRHSKIDKLLINKWMRRIKNHIDSHKKGVLGKIAQGSVRGLYI